IQLVPYGRDHTNPKVVAEPPWASTTTSATAVIACFDCHSNQTVWPWYSNIAPISWLVQRDVDEGRKRMNLSEWTQGQGSEAAEKVEAGEMPPFQYLLAHPEARLSDADKAAFIKGLSATFISSE
ncbi:MAG: heme-binding domain-containing protein, partial [Nocardioidaceae bacterium]